MVNICNSEQHVVLMRILDARNRPSITPDMPLWKLKLTEEEYTNLKETLAQNAYRLEDFGIEAALCYAEWWRRDYNGGIPSREDVAVGLGLPHYCWEQLYKAARHGLKSHGFAFIHSLKGNEYFRTLLNQGGLPVNYIKNGTNLSGFSRFLIGLVEELSSINIDWDDNNIDLIKNFNCIAYLGKAFKNDNIYDVSLQIAHAIISEEDRWLPYDDTDSSLSELTKSLKREYRRVKSEHRTKPLSLSWKLRLTSSETANLFVNLNIVKDNLRYFNIISHGQSGMIDVTYKSDKIEDDDTIKHLKSPVIEGIVPLSDYRDLFARMFQLYGANTFDRSSSIELKICDKRIYIRKFVLDSELSSDKIRITDYTSEDTSDFIYDGDVYALPVSENIKPAELVQIKLEPYNRQMNLFTIPHELLNSEAILFSGPESSRRLVPKYYNFEQEDYSSEVRGEMSAANIILWSERLSKDDVFVGEYWAKTVKAFRIISEFNLPFTTYNAFKSIGRDPKLLVNLILACWLNGASDVLIQEIDRFEDELNIAVHWIPHTVWGECIESFIRLLPPTLINIMNTKLGEITELINALFNATLSAEVASELTQYVAGGNIGDARIFSRADINQFKSKIHGYTDNNIDLPITRFVLQNKYYVDQEMHKSYRVMIESAMCAAENFAQVKNHTNLFLLESRDYARITNFYRKYFKETYSKIFIGTVKQIVNK